MRALDEVVAEADAQRIELALDAQALDRATGVGSESLFHTPLLSLTILVIARARREGLPTADVATWVLSTLVRKSETVAVNRRRVAWSVALRRRCADALVFLENAELIEVSRGPLRLASLTAHGRSFLADAGRSESEVRSLVRHIERAYRAIDQGGLLLV